MKFKNNEEIEKYCEENGISFPDIFEKDVDYIEAEIINPENEQKLIYALIPEEDDKYEQAKKELTITSHYHDWHYTTADKLTEIQYKAEEDAEDEAELIEEWNDLIPEYNKWIGYLKLYEDRDYLKPAKTIDDILNAEIGI